MNDFLEARKSKNSLATELEANKVGKYYIVLRRRG